MSTGRSGITINASEDGAALSLELVPELSVVGPMHDAIHAFLSRAGADRPLVRRVMLATEELVVNAIVHGRAGRGVTSLAVDLRHRPDRIATRIAYDGAPFDPTAARPRPSGTGTRPGGLGLKLVHNAADAVSYQRRGGRNIVSLSHAIPR